MFEVGDYIIYGNKGVRQVAEIGTMDMAGVPEKRLYYTLTPVYSKDGTIFTPVDNTKIFMRKIISKAEVETLIDEIRDIDTLWIADDKKREEIYKTAIGKCDCRELIKIIKTLYLRKESRIAAGKKVTSVDGKYLHIAEDILYGELAIPMGMSMEGVKSYIEDRVAALEAV